jgi:hypothetical protein
LRGQRQVVRALDHRFAPGKPALPGAADKKIALQLQLSDLGVQSLEIDCGFSAGAAGAEGLRRAVDKLSLPGSDLVGIVPPAVSGTPS